MLSHTQNVMFMGRILSELYKVFLHRLSCWISAEDSHDWITQYSILLLIGGVITVSPSCERSLLQNSHMIIHIKLVFYNSITHPMVMNYFCEYDLMVE